MKIALVSVDQVWESKNENFDLCHEYVKKSVELSADLVVFPEMTLTGYSMNTNAIAECWTSSVTISRFRKLATKYGVALIVGLAIEDNGFFKNSAIFIDKFGSVLTRYDKIHLFSMAGEGNSFLPGNSISIAEFDKERIGLTICYDLRFPELYSIISKKADIIINIASWPSQRLQHWNVLLQSRAIENQVFMVGVNRTGVDPQGNIYVDSSKIFFPNGDTVSPIHTAQNFKLYEIEPNLVNEYRNNFRVRGDRRDDLYRILNS